MYIAFFPSQCCGSSLPLFGSLSPTCVPKIASSEIPLPTELFPIIYSQHKLSLNPIQTSNSSTKMHKYTKKKTEKKIHHCWIPVIPQD